MTLTFKQWNTGLIKQMIYTDIVEIKVVCMLLIRGIHTISDLQPQDAIHF